VTGSVSSQTCASKGTEIIVHCGGNAKGDQDKTLNLVRAASQSGTSHLVYISVVGADRIPIVSGVDRAMFGYIRAKLAAEQVAANSGLPWTTLRTTQFHDAFLIMGKQMAKMPFVPVFAGVRFQPIDAGEVAARLVELALGLPAGLVPEMAGPRIYPMAELLRGYMKAYGKHRLVTPMRLPGKAARAVRAGANLSPDQAVGRVTWEDFLAERVGSAAISKSIETTRDDDHAGTIRATRADASRR
jgi:uncharacterized protein YbjT (DUF2867 family)